MSAPRAPVIAVSLGCPAGVGPEVAVLAASRAHGIRPLLVGDLAIIERAAQLRHVAKSRLVGIDGPAALEGLEEGQIGVLYQCTPLEILPEPGKPSGDAGAVQLAWIDEATDLVRSGAAAALVTGPVSKLAIASSGAAGAATFRGHTEHLAERLGAREVVMAFASGTLRTALVTTHAPLSEVPRLVTPEAVERATYWLVRLLGALGVGGSAGPRVVIAALNPHAGEGGLLGREEITHIGPGIERARARLAAEGRPARLTGPVGAETAYRQHQAGHHDGVVAMYHDQATIPCKLVGFGEAVNVTLGLPILRTSVDHGTGYDVAGTGEADARGMSAALELAATLALASPPSDGLRP
jgi:4-hydroxythreonine-4-phosphate dehydrogenase